MVLRWVSRSIYPAEVSQRALRVRTLQPNSTFASLCFSCQSTIFSTSIPPLNIAWSNWLLTEKRDYLINQKEKLEKLTHDVHLLLKKRGIETVSNSHIIPIIIGSNEDTLKVSEKLKSLGYYIPAIRPPTVPEGTSRLRISLTSDCRLSDFEKVLDNI